MAPAATRVRPASYVRARAEGSSERLQASSDILLFERRTLALGAVLAASEPYRN
jgi:hypothetical protein